jgi:CheY-like chemotaxis protein
MTQSRKVVALITDLMFMAKVQESAKRTGFEAIFAKTADDVIAKSAERPAVIILDLNANGVAPLETIRRLKSVEQTSTISLLGYVSHVDADLRSAAQEAGCDRVIARSAFSRDLPALLESYAGSRA